MSKCLWFLVIAACGCGGARDEPARAAVSTEAVAPMATAVAPSAAGNADRSAGPAAVVQHIPNESQTVERAVVRNVSLQLTHKAPDNVIEQATILARAAGGYALNGTTQTAAGAVLSSMVVLEAEQLIQQGLQLEGREPYRSQLFLTVRRNTTCARPRRRGPSS